MLEITLSFLIRFIGYEMLERCGFGLFGRWGTDGFIKDFLVLVVEEVERVFRIKRVK